MSTLAQIVKGFDTNPMSAARSMREMVETNAARFFEDVKPILSELGNDGGGNYLLWLILHNGLAARLLCDSSILSSDEARLLAERLRKLDPSFEMTLFRHVFGLDGAGAINDIGLALRVLDILTADCDTRLLPLITRLLNHRDPKVRSKAAVLVGRMSSTDYDWIQRSRREPDARVRANALEGLWTRRTSDRLRTLLWSAIDDADNRVVGNALLALYRQGECGTIPLISALAKHSSEAFRATAAWIIGETGDKRFVDDVVPLVRESNSLVRRNALKAVSKLKRKEQVSSLEDVTIVPFSVPENAKVAEPSSDEAEVLCVATVSPDGSPVTTFKAEDFTVWRNSRPVQSFQVRTVPGPESISIAFALPKPDAEDKRWRQIWNPMFLRCLGNKRRWDYWSFVEYAIARVSKADESKSRAAEEAKYDAFGRERLQFFKDPIDLDRLFSGTIEFDQAATVADALDRLLTPSPAASSSVAVPKWSQHAVIIETSHSGEFDAERKEIITSAALNSGVTIHLISSNRFSQLTDMVRQTGGTHLPFKGKLEACEPMIATLCGSLFSRYRIELPRSPQDTHPGTEFKIQVRRGNGRSEARISASPAVAQAS